MAKKPKSKNPLAELLSNSQNLAGYLTKEIVSAAKAYDDASKTEGGDTLQALWSEFSALVVTSVPTEVLSSLGGKAHIQLYHEALRHKDEFLGK